MNSLIIYLFSKNSRCKNSQETQQSAHGEKIKDNETIASPYENHAKWGHFISRLRSVSV